MKDRLWELVKETSDIPVTDKEKICKLLKTALDETIEYNSKILGLKYTNPTRNFTISKFKEAHGVSVGVNRTNGMITLAEWMLKLQPTTKNYLLSFLIVKEGLLQFFNSQVSDLDEAIVNIVAILWLKKEFDIKSLDHPLLAAIQSRMYTEVIAGIDYLQFNNLLIRLFIKNILFDEAFLKYLDVIKVKDISLIDTFKQYSSWITSQIKDEDVVAPIFLRTKMRPILEALVELGFEKGSTSKIAKKLDMHVNTARYYCRELTTSHSIFWRPIINLEKLKLHNYLLKIKLLDKSASDLVYNLVWNTPYLKSIFTGSSDEHSMFYSPTLVCPHIVSEQLNEQLRKLENKGLIEYNLQLLREKVYYGTVTSRILNPTIKTFDKLLFKEVSESDIEKYMFAHEKLVDSSLEFDDKNIPFDYNLLYFLSILKSKFLLKSRYGVQVTELPKFYEKNDIPVSDVSAQTDFISQIEIRARRRKLLTYALYMRSFSKSPEIFIFDISSTDNYSDKVFKETIEKLRVFSFLGQMTIYDRHLMILPGINHDHPIRGMIQKVIDKAGLKAEYYTVRFDKSRFVPLHDLFDFDTHKWK